MAAQWAARAAELRQQQDRASQTIAGALERISGTLLAEVAAAASVPAPANASGADDVVHDADYWRARLARCQPYRCPVTGVMLNEGEIMDRHRARLQARIDGRPLPPIGAPAPVSPIPVATAPEFQPPPEVVPFTMGPQTDMFGMLG